MDTDGKYSRSGGYEHSVAYIYKVGVLIEIKSLQNICLEIPSTTIASCWCNSKLCFGILHCTDAVEQNGMATSERNS